MRKNFLIIFVSILLVFAAIFAVSKKVMFFVYANPYTETSGFPYIAKTLNFVDDILHETKTSLFFDKKKIKYIYQNPYGSGFLKNNPIPNDLDYAVGVDLGTYEYNGKNQNEIATELVDKINAFYFYFISNIYNTNKAKFYSSNSPFAILDATAQNRALNIKDIEDNLDNVVNERRYVKYTTVEKTEDMQEDITMPYMLNFNEILLQHSKQLKLYTDTITYSKDMPRYLREFSIIPEFYVTLKYKGKTFDFELVPEVFPGTRLQLSRRCFGSTVFDRLYSLKFLKNASWLKDDETYIYTRMLSFRRHLGEIENLQSLKKSPVKILKRMMQSAEMVKPLIKKDDYDIIVDFVKTNFENKDMQLLNEVLNIYKNMYDITWNSELLNNIVHSNKLNTMYTIADKITQELKSRGNVDKLTISELERINKYIKENILTIESGTTNNFDSTDFEKIKDEVEKVVVSNMNSMLYKPERVKTIVDIFTKIYTEAGFHRVKFVWLDKDKLGIVEDDFTKTIKDYKTFTAENYLPEDVEYSIESKQKLKANNKHYVSFNLWIKYNPTSEQKVNYNKLIKALLDDKANFKPKSKWVVVK